MYLPYEVKSRLDRTLCAMTSAASIVGILLIAVLGLGG